MKLKKLFSKINIKNISKEEDHVKSLIALNNIVILLKNDFSFQNELLSKMKLQQEKDEHIKKLKNICFGAAIIERDKYKLKTISLKLEDMLYIFPSKSIKLISITSGGYLDLHSHASPKDIVRNINRYEAPATFVDGKYFGIKKISYWEFDKDEMKEFQKQEQLKEFKKEEKDFDLIYELESLSKKLLTVIDDHEIKTYLVKYQDTFENLDISLKDSLNTATPLTQKAKDTLSDLLKDFHSTMLLRINEIEKEKQDFIKFDEEARQLNYKEIINFEKDFQINNLL